VTRLMKGQAQVAYLKLSPCSKACFVLVNMICVSSPYEVADLLTIVCQCCDESLDECSKM